MSKKDAMDRLSITINQTDLEKRDKILEEILSRI
jgi:hypothetical protein